jgi:hypothetical protein
MNMPIRRHLAALTLALSVLAAPILAAGPAAAQTPDKPAKVRKSKGKKPTVEAAPEAAPTAPAPTDAEPSLRRSNRMELDARLIQGSTPEAGAVYLFQRAPRNLPALVRLRQSYLAEIVTPVLGPDHAAAPTAEATAP